MTVKQLIAWLEKLNPELHVYLSNDEELNGIHECLPPEVMLVDEDHNLYCPEHDEIDADFQVQEIVVL